MILFCDVCDRPATYRPDQHPHYDGWAEWMFGATWPALCKTCWQAADNDEPADADGEAFRGGEAAEALAEQQADAQRLK